MTNPKKKGNYWERKFAGWLKDNGINAWRDSGSGGGTREKSDIINNININFEVKSGKQVPKKIYDFYDQSIEASTKTHTTPLVVLHRDNRPQDEFLIVMNSYDWLDLWKKAQEPKVLTTESREQKWLIQNTIKMLKKLLKTLEKY